VADCFQVTTTLPNEATAQQVGARLVEERLAACAQVLGPVSSTYRWKGGIEQAAEWYCNIKTTKARLAALKKRIRELHPYEVPEIVAIRIEDGDADYLKWIEEEVGIAR
jgi:periplasmic divalent cation tolerance protein